MPLFSYIGDDGFGGLYCDSHMSSAMDQEPMVLGIIKMKNKTFSAPVCFRNRMKTWKAFLCGIFISVIKWL